MVSDDIPVLAFQKWGLTLKRSGKEFHSPCFNCGGRDRLITWELGNYYCRQCGVKGWLDSTHKPMDLAERARILAEDIARRKQIEQSKLNDWQEGFKTGYLYGWHDAMSAQQRDWWHRQGMTDEIIDGYVLGYCPNKRVRTEDGTYYTAGAYTIPILDRETHKLVNIQYRLEAAPEGVGKYRQEFDIPARNFYPGYEPGRDVIVVEGAKKALVLFHMLDKEINVVGIPGISPNYDLIDELAVFKRKWFIPDPDVNAKQIRKFSDRLTDLRIVRLPVKPDDAVVHYRMNRASLAEYCAKARVVA